MDDALTGSGAADALTWSQQIVPFAYSAVARGAEGLFFSRWRPAPFGADQLRPGLLNHDGTPTRGLEAAARLARSLTKGHEGVLRGAQESEVALLVCHESAWALAEKPDPNIAYWDHVSLVHSALSQHTPGLSIIGPTARFAPYKVIVAPALYLLRGETAKALREYVKGGGHLVLTCMSGIKDADNNVWTTGLPGGMREALGAVVKGFGRIPSGAARKLRMAATERAFSIRDWNDLIELQGAKTLALYAEGPLKGLPAASVNSFGPGRAYYIGAYAEAEFYHSLLETVCREAQVTARPAAADGVEIIARGGVTFVLNRSFESKTVSLDGLYEDALRGSKYRGQIELPPDGAFVLKKIG
jgi:beta-galactosidase